MAKQQKEEQPAVAQQTITGPAAVPLAEDLGELDNLPQPPPSQVNGASDDVPFSTDTAQFESGIDEKLWESIPDEPEPIKRGVYHFRLEGYKKSRNDKGPYFKLQWKCKEEPWTGRVVFDNAMTWCDPWVFEAAQDPSSPEHAKARTELRNRLFRARAFCKNLGVKLSKDRTLESVLQTNPELKIRVKESERMEKMVGPDGAVTYKGTGKITQNEIVEYLPLT